MKISPIDITHKEFGKKMLGYDAEEVQAFLQMIADEMEKVIRERNQLRESSREKDLQLMEYKERDKALRETISTAQRMSEKIQEEAQRETKIVVNDAHQQADIIVKDARESLKRIYQEISELKRMKIQFETNMRSMLQAHLTLMETQDQFLVQPKLNTVSISENLSTRVSPVRAQTSET